MQFVHNNHEVYSETDFEANPKTSIAETDRFHRSGSSTADIHGMDFYFLDCIDSWAASGDLLQQVGTRDVLYICTPDGGGYRRTTGSQVDTYSRLH